MTLTVSYIHRFLTSFGFSIIVETIVLLLILKVLTRHNELSWRRIIIAGVFATFATIPYVWFVFPNLLEWPKNTALLYSEVFVIVVEALFFRLYLKTSWSISFSASIFCNLSSYLLGPFLRAQGLWIYW